MDIKERIFALADAQFAEQRDFAAAINVSANVVSTWRTGKTASYSKRLPEIAAVLGTTVEYLLTGEAQKKPADGAVDELELFRQYLKEYNKDLKGCTHEELRGLAQMAALWLDK